MIRLLILVASVAAQAAGVTDLAWLAGNWSGQMGRASIEERWTEPAGGAMLAVSRTIAGTRMVEFEFLRIIERNGEIFYVAQPGGRSPVEFKLTSSGPSNAVFENPAHDFPKRIAYQLEGDTLTATISGGEKKLSFSFLRTPRNP